ncbi:MAG: hypothetical protein NZM12_06800 [Steroidobacteraceae bacterium]|nr:hypothetical protein [Steroidobacteraceae bacterium]MDW8258853.1 hypothetical protein [Gammaproteobacteria bacterium]
MRTKPWLRWLVAFLDRPVVAITLFVAGLTMFALAAATVVLIDIYYWRDRVTDPLVRITAITIEEPLVPGGPLTFTAKVERMTSNCFALAVQPRLSKGEESIVLPIYLGRPAGSDGLQHNTVFLPDGVPAGEYFFEIDAAFACPWGQMRREQRLISVPVTVQPK